MGAHSALCERISMTSFSPGSCEPTATLMRGESVKITIDYDLFDNNLLGLTGIYLKTTTETGKILVYFPKFEEWGEFKENEFERLSPGTVPDENKEFVSRVKTLGYLPTI